MNLKEIKNKNEEELEEILSLIKWDKENPNPFGYGNPNEDTLKSFLRQALQSLQSAHEEEMREIYGEIRAKQWYFQKVGWEASSNHLEEILKPLKDNQQIND